MNGLQAFYTLKSEITEYDEKFESLFLCVEEDLKIFYKIRDFWKSYDFKIDSEKTIIDKLMDIPISEIKYMATSLRMGIPSPKGLKNGKNYSYGSSNFYELYLNRKKIWAIPRISLDNYIKICDRFKEITGLSIFDDVSYTFLLQKKKTRKNYNRTYKAKAHIDDESNIKLVSEEEINKVRNEIKEKESDKI